LFAQLVSKIVNHVVIIHQHRRQTDGQTTCDHKTMLYIYIRPSEL